MALSSTSPDDGSLERDPSTGGSGRSKHPAGPDKDLGNFESVGYYDEAREDDEAARAERRMREMRDKAQAEAAARAAQRKKAGYVQMNPNDHEAWEQDRRIGGVEGAVAASTVVHQFNDLFPEFTRNEFLRAGIAWAPLALFMKPRRRGDGFGGFATDPRVLSLALMGGMAFVAEATRKMNQFAEDLRRGPARPDEIERSNGESADKE